MCKYCEIIRNSENVECDIFCYTKRWKYIDDEWEERITKSQILNNVPVKYCPVCGRKLGD